MQPVTRFFLDTEFLEDGKQIHLISVGMVREDGNAIFYAVNKDAPWEAIYRHGWLKANVMPHIQHEVLPHRINLTDPNAMSRIGIRNQLLDFVDTFTEKDTKAEFWGYYADYDHVAICQLYGTMINLPPGFPMFTMDLKQWAVQLGVDSQELPSQGEDTHHSALGDALWNVMVFKHLQKVDRDAAILSSKEQG